MTINFCDPLPENSFLAPVHDRIPPGLATNECWMLHRRRAVPKSTPVAFFRPDNFVPEPYGFDEGIPLYRFDQTRDYAPTPATIAAQRYYDFFVASQNRHRHSVWKRGWLTFDRYLSRSKVREHLRGKEIYGCWGNIWTTWFAIDVDFHGRDQAPFLNLLRILEELPDFLPAVRWTYFLNRSRISGLHIVGLLPRPRLLDDVRDDVRKVRHGSSGPAGLRHFFAYVGLVGCRSAARWPWRWRPARTV